jgi:16S rRNA (uracil1498-N3)-methyltransferase
LSRPRIPGWNTVNLILFDPEEVGRPLARSDARAEHILNVLGRRVGDRFDAGVVDGPRGKGTVVAVGEDGLAWQFGEAVATPELDPITLVVGLPRPQTARKILSEISALGVRALHFVRTDRGEPNYAASTLWSSGEWRRHVRTGVEQAFSTRLPQVTHSLSLREALEQAGAGAQVALDNYEAAESLARVPLGLPFTAILGSERGWSAAERDLLRERGATLAHLGARVLRVETACVSAVMIAKARLGLL